MNSSFKKIQELVSSLFDLCVDRATICLKNDECSEANVNAAVDWLYVAASLAWCVNPGCLRSIEIEQILSRISICTLGITRVGARPLNAKCTHVVHVATAVSLRGGHTRVIARWIDNCRMFAKDQVHHLVLTGQGSADIPEWLADTVRETGGECVVMDGKSGWIERAKQLREYAIRRADVFVLHMHPNDPIINLALFGMKEQLPVFMFNHADHVFSLGVGVCNGVLDFRKSGQDLSSRYRGVNSAIIPLPMVVEERGGQDRRKLRCEARKRLNIDLEGFVALTIGDEYKYKSALGCSFIECVRRMLKSEADLTLIAVGIPDKNEWTALASESQNRFVPIGSVLDKSVLNDYYVAADIYMEGFPFSSLTAMIDAGLYCLPIQRMRNVKLPILSGDDVALDGLVGVATNCDEYVAGVRQLMEMKPDARERSGVAIRDSIKICHCGEMWFKTYVAPLFTQSIVNNELLFDGSHQCLRDIAAKSEQEDSALDALAQFQWETRGAFVVTLISMARSPLSLIRSVNIALNLIFKNLRVFSAAAVLLVLLVPLFLTVLRYVPKRMIVRASRKR